MNLWLVVGLRWRVAGVLWSNIIAKRSWAGAWPRGLSARWDCTFSRRATRDLLRYGLPMMATWAATFIVTYGDRYILQAQGGSSHVGL